MDYKSNELMEKMTEILLKKQALLKEMLALTCAQTEAISQENLDELEKLIEEKQLKIDEIDKLDEKFSGYFDELKKLTGVRDLAELDVSGMPGVKELKEATEAVLSIVNEISRAEEVNSNKSRELLDKIGENIKKINQGKKVTNAYYPTLPNQPSFFVDNKK